MRLVAFVLLYRGLSAGGSLLILSGICTLLAQCSCGTNLGVEWLTYTMMHAITSFNATWGCGLLFSTIANDNVTYVHGGLFPYARLVFWRPVLIRPLGYWLPPLRLLIAWRCWFYILGHVQAGSCGIFMQSLSIIPCTSPDWVPVTTFTTIVLVVRLQTRCK